MENGNERNAAKDVRGLDIIDPSSLGIAAPKAASNPASEPIAPGIGAGNSFAESAPRKRGRPKGSKNKGRVETAPGQKAALPVDRDAISAILLSCHAMLAGIAKTPELAIDKQESDALADASAKVAELYDVSADPKTVAWCNLAMTVGMIYGTRFIAISARRKNERAKRREKVVPINGADFSSGVTPGAGKLPDWDTGPLPPRTKQ